MFTHGDLQVNHVFVDDDEITGVVNWSEACQGDALFDLAVLTLGHEEHLGDVVAGYGTNPTATRVLCLASSRSEPPSGALETIRRLHGRRTAVTLPRDRLDDQQVAGMVRQRFESP